MSDETPPAKKAARKSPRKKSATKKAASKSAEESSSEELPLADNESQTKPEKKASKKAAQKKNREPRGGVRDARSESAKSEDNNSEAETVEKLVPDDSSDSKKSEKSRDEDQQDRGDQRERRGRNRGRGRGNNREREVKARPPVDKDHLRKKAWKIYESEVTEEGLALLDDSGLRDYARASFNAARIFLEEEGRVLAKEKEARKKEEEKDHD